MNVHEAYFHEDSGNASRDASLGVSTQLERLTSKPPQGAFLARPKEIDGNVNFGKPIEPEWAYYVVGLKADHAMSVKLDPHNRLKGSANLLLALAVALVMMLFFLRMVAFVVGHGHHTL